jgi:two-component system, sensor histidine kinase and response regulator
MEQDLEKAIRKYQARIRQMETEIVSRHEENAQIIAENLRQTEELREFNHELDQKVKERTRQLQELGEAKDALMHMIVHDMKNPLTVVLGNLTFLKKKRFNLDQAVLELLSDAHQHSVKLLDMIEEILTISRMQSKEFKIQPEPLDFIAIIRQSVTTMSKAADPKNLTIRVQPDNSELILPGDARTLERIVNNLLNNAIKYAPQGSEIAVEVSRAEDSALVSVANWGEAIPEAFHEKIFEIFCRVKPEDTKIKGTGLGLTFVKLALEAHGGRIHVESPLPPKDCGARFVFSLPLAVPAAQAR